MLKEQEIGEIFIVSPHAPVGQTQAKWLSFPNVPSFAAQCNFGALKASGDFLLLLNDDVELPFPIAQSLLSAFSEPEVFAVTPQIWNLQNGIVRDEGITRLFWRNYFLWAQGSLKPAQPFFQPFPVPYFSGACVLLRKDLFLHLGGFDTNFSPAYWEDVDLSIRAWRRGFKILHHPAGPVWHHRGRTTGNFPRIHQDFLYTHNQLFFHWKHLLHEGKFRLFRLGEISRLFTSLFQKKWFYYAAYREIHSKIPSIQEMRKKEKAEAVWEETHLWDTLLKEIR